MPEQVNGNRPVNKQTLLMVILVLVILFPLVYAVVGSAVSRGSGSSEVFLEKATAPGDTCIQAVEYMRLHHWELLRQTREEVVRYGVRDETGLDKCKNCHTSRERFCDKCHLATSLTPDCWGCHYYP